MSFEISTAQLWSAIGVVVVGLVGVAWWAFKAVVYAGLVKQWDGMEATVKRHQMQLDEFNLRLQLGAQSFAMQRELDVKIERRLERLEERVSELEREDE